MRSLPSVIKGSQYTLVAAPPQPPPSPREPGREGGETDRKAEPAGVSFRQEEFDRALEEIKDRVRREALEKAGDIMAAADAQCKVQLDEAARQIEEEKARVQEESARLREESARLREESRSRGFEEGKKEGTEQGRHEGFDEGMRRAEESERGLLEEMKRVLSDMEAQKTQILHDFEQDIQELALSIAQKVIKMEVNLQGDVMQSIILEAIKEYRDQEWVNISVSPRMADFLTAGDVAFLSTLREVSPNVRIVASPERKDGDCLIDMPGEVLDVGVDTQMENIRRELSRQSGGAA